MRHPARFALVEIVNLHDEALSFEPIYRVMFGVHPADVLDSLRAYATKLSGTAAPQSVTCIGTFDSYHWVIEFFIDTNCTIVEYDFAEVTIPSYMRYRRVQCNGITMKHDFDE